MITFYTQHADGITVQEFNVSHKVQLNSALWIDLVYPTEDEIQFISDYLHLEMPSKKEMEEIEPSSRLYIEGNALFLTATMVAQSEHPEPKSDAVSFVLTNNKLITIRHIEPQAFNLFITMVKKTKTPSFSAISLLTSLLEITTDRLADILEKISDKFDEISHGIFHKEDPTTAANGISYKEILQTIGINRILASKIRDSLNSFIRIASFLEKGNITLDHELHARLGIINKDVAALSDYAIFISTEVNFLLDATLGMISIEQNAIIKIFSVAAVIFLPPTLIASIYGMNFKHMPELTWFGGYPLALLLMMISAWIPYHYFRKKKWL
ncbi:cobalt/magnesium uptake transporter [Legionella adelaidensis]|uniref:Magnesium transport protein CorA n=1 Tax=Legionella adelaidensis TaxID=45056 RepID=A0A0W0R643_9GAMM|nr:magnesium transporter CorA family protein [Legionella adelaidensis]KTC66559.1 cobalt/magnesium uptake transporter [Legionella adelaidensis]